jgi:hypothetical protein
LTYGQWLLFVVLVNDEPGLVAIYNAIIVYGVIDLQATAITAVVE